MSWWLNEGQAPIPEDMANRSMSLQIWRFLSPPTSETSCQRERSLCLSPVSISCFHLQKTHASMPSCLLSFYHSPESLVARRTHCNSLSLHKSRLKFAFSGPRSVRYNYQSLATRFVYVRVQGRQSFNHICCHGAGNSSPSCLTTHPEKYRYVRGITQNLLHASDWI